MFAVEQARFNKINRKYGRLRKVPVQSRVELARIAKHVGAFHKPENINHISSPMAYASRVRVARFTKYNERDIAGYMLADLAFGCASRNSHTAGRCCSPTRCRPSTLAQAPLNISYQRRRSMPCPRRPVLTVMRLNYAVSGLLGSM